MSHLHSFIWILGLGRRHSRGNSTFDFEHSSRSPVFASHYDMFSLPIRRPKCFEASDNSPDCLTQLSRLGPISLLSKVGKICEGVLTWIIQSDSLILPNQLGFRSGICTSDGVRLAHYLCGIYSTKKCSLSGMFMDITKAHDRLHTVPLFSSLREI